MSRTILVTYDDSGVSAWGEGFVPRIEAGLNGLGEVRTLDLTGRRDAPLSAVTCLSDVDALAVYSGRLTAACVTAAPRLRLVGNIGDNRGLGVDYSTLRERDIPVVDTTRGWAQSVAEVGLNLMLSCLRQSAWWHSLMAAGNDVGRWPGGQFCDNPAFVNGELAGKRVGIVGLGAIGRVLARLLTGFPTGTIASDPYVSDGVFASVGAERVELDELLAASQLVAVCVPPNPTSRGMIDARRVALMPKGSILVLITRAAPVDMEAVRRRVLTDDLFLGADVFDIEPLPPDDALRNRPNVVHFPHIAGRTQNARDRMADLLIADFRRFFAGEPLECALPPEVVALNAGAP